MTVQSSQLPDATTGTQLAVWGDPIDHSRSPDLHGAAYRALGLHWEYTCRRVAAADFADTVSTLDDRWRGLSLTMPLKERAFAWAAFKDRAAMLTGGVNTLVLTGRLRGHGFNTDIAGLVAALDEAGLSGVGHVRILGAGATAASAVVAAADLGATHVEVIARRAEAARPLRDIATAVGVELTITPFSGAFANADLTISTLPGGVALDERVSATLAHAGGALFDVAYSPWPSVLAKNWTDAPRISGLGMLLHQAVRQVRIFVNEDPLVALPDEAVIVAEMRAAVMGD